MPDAVNPLSQPAPWDAVSEAYTNELLPLFESFARDALRLAELPPGPRIADIATGPGTLSILAAQAGAQVSALDFSAPMLEQLRRRAKAANLNGTLDLHQGDGQNLPFESDSFDGAFSMFGLIFFPNRDAGFKELRRVLKPGRRAVVSSWAPLEGPFGLLMEIVKAEVPGMAGSPGVPVPPPVLGHPEDYQREMRAAGFSQVRVESILHEREAPSVAHFWESVQRSNPSLLAVRGKIGEAAWGKIAPTVLAKVRASLGNGKVVIKARAQLGIGVK